MNLLRTILLLFLSMVQVAQISAQENHKAYITVKAPHYSPSDTLVLRVFRKYHFGRLRNDNPSQLLKLVSKTGEYNFEMDSIANLSRIHLYKSDEVLFGDLPAMPILNSHLLNPGDSIQIYVYPKGEGWTSSGNGMDNGKMPRKDVHRLRFAGKGSEKFIARLAIDSLEGSNYEYKEMPFVRQSKEPYFSNDFEDFKSLLQWGTLANRHKWNMISSALELYKPYLSEDVYMQLYTDYLGAHYSNVNYHKRFSFYFPQRVENWNLQRENFLDHYAMLEGESIPLKYRRNSPAYLDYFEKWIDNHYSIDHRGGGIHKSMYDLIKAKAPIGLREQLLASEVLFLYGHGERPEMLNDAREIIKDPYLLKQLEDLDQLAVGKPAAKFELLDKDDNKVSSDQFKGKVVFMDFWYLACRNCHIYLDKTVKPVYEKYKNDDRVVFLTVAAEQRQPFLKGLEWAGLHGSNAYNLYTGTSTFKHPLIQYYKIRGYPHPMMIGKDGNIFSRADKRLRNQEGLIEAIEEALAQ